LKSEHARHRVRRAVVTLVAACSSSEAPRQYCFCNDPVGPGWCQEGIQPIGECECPKAVLCPGWCVTDSGEFNPVQCDAGTSVDAGSD
jgi:hypothetical protein